MEVGGGGVGAPRGGIGAALAHGGMWSHLDVAETFHARLLGLMPDALHAWRARRAGASRGETVHDMPARCKASRALLFPRCAAVHTCGMAAPVDVAFLDGRGIVFAAYRAVKPWRFLRMRGACSVVERLACAAPWLEEGECLPGWPGLPPEGV